MSQTTQDAPLAPKRSGVPVIGSAVAFARDPYALYEDIASHGDVVRFSLGSYDMATVLHPDGIEQVLVDDFDRFDKPGAAASGADVLADGLLLSDGEQWHRQRTGLQPLFYRERIETYADTMATYAAAAADEWAAADAVDLGEATSTYTLRVLGKTLFGIDTDEYREAVRAGAEAILERTSQNPVAMDIPQWLPTPSNRRYERGIDRLDGVVADLLAERDSGSDRDDLLSLLVDMRSDGELDEAEIRSQLVTFLFAGHETTATALTWALAELGRNPGVARRLRAEVDAVLDGGCATPADLPALTYTEQIVRETLRRYPSASAVFRETDEAVTVDGYRIPADTFLTLPQFHVHTDERWWDDPMEFDPSRWDDITEPPGDRPEYAYFPFGGGPRHCIGMRFARMELQLALATVAKRCRIVDAPDEVEAAVGSTVHPADPVEVTFQRRT
jgi:cytochrome P450